jgi:menaquinone-specific isochorismate synthase
MTQSRISTTVIPSSERPIEDENNFNYFDLNNIHTTNDREVSKIVSFSKKINSIDPLAFLQKFAREDSLHFYWENSKKQEAIAACGVVTSIATDSLARFDIARTFVKNCLKKTIKKGDNHLPGAGPHFFCSFTFFDRSNFPRSPFPAGTIFLPKFQVYKKNSSCTLVVNLAVDDRATSQTTERDKIKYLLERLDRQIKDINWSNYNGNNFAKEDFRQPKLHAKIEQAHDFQRIVNSALKEIAVNKFSKIVVANAIDAISTQPFQIIESLNNLRKRHPDCYVFSTSNGKGHNFIGASPERLISIQNQQLVTDALAGSAPRGKTVAEDIQQANLLLKSRKEKREHQAVSDFITERLQELGLNPQKLPLQVLQLSNIQHLWTPIYAHLSHNLDPLEIVAKMHPTPAVAGVPMQIACDRIRSYEKFDRSLYASPLGWLDAEGNCEFLVGIRSALIQGNHARLYAGAGIVAGSNPDKELAEVQLKFQSLLNSLI